MDKKQKHKLKKFVNELKAIRGRHTELVSVYIPAGYDLNKIIQHLQQEQHTASNIKDARTRKNVIDSLERAVVHLRLFKKTPEHGLAIFSGNASDKENKTDIKVWSIEPPEPLNTRMYRCDQTFVLDILENMMEVKEAYGLIVVDRRDGDIGLLKGTAIIPIVDFKSDVPGKTTKGGQSQSRYAGIREEATKDFFKKVGNAANKEFLEMKNLKGILIGGPGPTKHMFIDGNYMNNEIKKKIISIQDLSYTGDFGLNELVEKSQEVLAKEVIIEEKKILNRFFEILAKEPEKVTYGKKETEKAIDMGAVEVLLLSDDLDDDTIENLSERAEKTGSKVDIISTETKEGVQLKEIGGMAAILRFQIS